MSEMQFLNLESTFNCDKRFSTISITQGPKVADVPSNIYDPDTGALTPITLEMHTFTVKVHCDGCNTDFQFPQDDVKPEYAERNAMVACELYCPKK